MGKRPCTYAEADHLFANAVTRVRKARGISLREFSARIGILPSGIFKLEAGTRRVTIGEAVAIADALDVPLADLISGEPVNISV